MDNARTTQRRVAGMASIQNPKGHCRFVAHLSIPFVRARPDPDWKSGLPKISADFGFLAAPTGGKTDWKPKSSTKPTL